MSPGANPRRPRCKGACSTRDGVAFDGDNVGVSNLWSDTASKLWLRDRPRRCCESVETLREPCSLIADVQHPDLGDRVVVRSTLRREPQPQGDQPAMAPQADAHRHGGRYTLAVAALATGVALGLVLGLVLPALLPATTRQALPSACTHVHNEIRQIKTDAARNDPDRLSDAVQLLDDRPDCFGDHEREELEGLRTFLERDQPDS